MSQPGEIRLERVFDAAPEEVFEAWGDAESLAAWMCPGSDMASATVEVDFRVGGRFRIVMHGSEQEFTQTGEYLEIDPPRRLAFTWVSDFIADGWERAMRLAQTKHDLVPICVTDPREEDLADMGVVYVEDSETGDILPVDTSSRWVRAAYRDEMKRRRSEREQLFRKHKVDFINMSTGDETMSALVDFFRIRARRARR